MVVVSLIIHHGDGSTLFISFAIVLGLPSASFFGGAWLKGSVFFLSRWSLVQPLDQADD